MLLFGHRFIESEKFYHISDSDSVINTPPSSTLYIEFSEDNLDIINYLQESELAFVINVKNITELIYAEALHSRYITVNKELAKSAQNIAENYLFDAKILVHAEDENEIEEMAILGVDGLLFPEAIIKVNS